MKPVNIFRNIKLFKFTAFKIFINVLLFILTFFTTTIAGVAWQNQNPYELTNLSYGLPYSFLILLVISTHEFGHYFAARYHKINVTLPFYIPFPFIEFNPFGTMGAVIKMKSVPQSRKALFDVGVAGPIAGWITTVVILIIGYLTLPGVDFIYKFHPEYAANGIPATGLTFGSNLLILLFEKIIPQSGSFVPPMNEIYHYPFLCVGWFGLLITSLNLLPVGQLDGGHISYTLFGRKHKILANIIFILLVVFGLLGFLPLLDININIGSINWLVWAVLIWFVIKIEHPPVIDESSDKLDFKRILLGWFSFFILLVSFFPIPILDA